MRAGLDGTATGLRVRPMPELGRTALIGGSVSLLPVFAAVLWLTRESGAWPVIVLGEVAVAALYASIYIRFRMVYVSISADHFRKQRLLLSPVQVDLSLVDRVLIHRVYRSSSTEALTQMMAVDSLGRRLFAMNQLFWSNADIHAVADAIGCQITSDDSPVSRHDYYECHPVGRRWYSHRLAVVGIVFVVAGLLSLIIAAGEAIAGTAS